jgi:hypothetical protein
VVASLICPGRASFPGMDGAQHGGPRYHPYRGTAKFPPGRPGLFQWAGAARFFLNGPFLMRTLRASALFPLMGQGPCPAATVGVFAGNPFPASCVFSFPATRPAPYLRVTMPRARREPGVYGGDIVPHGGRCQPPLFFACRWRRSISASAMHSSMGEFSHTVCSGVRAIQARIWPE